MNLYKTLHKLLAGLVRALYRVETEGLENEPESGPLLICSNHVSNQDVVVLAAALRRRQIRYFAKAELFKIPLLKQLITALGAFPVNRGGMDVSSIKRTLAILDEGHAVGFYPQGTRYKGTDPRQTQPKHGVGLIAYRSGAPILPVCIQVKKWRMLPLRRTKITFGKPIPPEELAMTVGNREEYSRVSQYIFDRICSMIED